MVEFDAIVTAEDAGSYKPSLGNFDYMMQRLGRGHADGEIRKEHILHTAESLFHDHQPANAFGLASCWIYSRHHGSRRDPARGFQVNSMADLVKAHRQEVGG